MIDLRAARNDPTAWMSSPWKSAYARASGVTSAT